MVRRVDPAARHPTRLALLDEERRVIRRTPGISRLPLAALPARPIERRRAAGGHQRRTMQQLTSALRPLTRAWTAPDGRHHRLLFARIPVPAGSLAGPGTRAVLAVFALDQTRRQIVHNRLKVFAITLLVSAIASALLERADRAAAHRRRAMNPTATYGQISARPPRNGCRSRPRRQS